MSLQVLLYVQAVGFNVALPYEQVYVCMRVRVYCYYFVSLQVLLRVQAVGFNVTLSYEQVYVCVRVRVRMGGGERGRD